MWNIKYPLHIMANYLVRFSRWLDDVLQSQCDKCKDGRVFYDRTESNVEIYKCDKCKSEFK